MPAHDATVLIVLTDSFPLRCCPHLVDSIFNTVMQLTWWEDQCFWEKKPVYLFSVCNELNHTVSVLFLVFIVCVNSVQQIQAMVLFSLLASSWQHRKDWWLEISSLQMLTATLLIVPTTMWCLISNIFQSVLVFNTVIIVFSLCA